MVRGDATSHTYERTIQPLPKLGPWVDELERRLEANERTKRRRFLSAHRDNRVEGGVGAGDVKANGTGAQLRITRDNSKASGSRISHCLTASFR